MATRFLAAFGSEKGGSYLVYIDDSDFAGSTTDFKVERLEITWQGETEERFSPIIGSRAKVSMIVNSATLETFVTDLIGAAEGRFTLKVGHDLFGSDPWTWNGFILPDLVAVEDTDLTVGYVFSVEAVDGIGSLKTIEYNDAGTPYTGKETFTAHILNCLNKLPSVQNLFSGTDIVLRMIANWHEDSWTYSATTNPMDKCRVDHNVFVEIDRYGNYNYMSCYDVIKAICLAFGARFIYSGLSYYFIQVNSYRGADNINVFKYRKDGTKSTDTGLDLGVDNDNTDQENTELVRLSGGEFRYFAPLNRSSVRNKVFDTNNLTPGETWDQGDETQITVSDIDSNTGTAKLSIQGEFAYMTDWNTGAATFQPHWIIWRITVRIGSNYLKRDFSISGGVVTYGATTWEGSASYFYYVGEDRITVDGSSVSGFRYTKLVNFITPAIPADGDLIFNIEYYKIYGDAGSSQDYDFFGYITSKTWSFSSVYLELLTDGTFSGQSSIREYRYDNSAYTTNSATYTTTTILGDASSRLPIRPGFIQIENDAATWVDTVNAWTIGGSGESTVNMQYLLAREIIRGQITPVERFFGSFQVRAPGTRTYQPHRFILRNSLKYVCQEMTYDVKTDIIRGAWFVMQDSAATTDYTQQAVILRPDEEPTTARGGGASGGGTTPTPGGGSSGSGGSAGKMAYSQTFSSHASVTLTITANSGALPATEAQILVFRNGQYLDPAYWSVSGADITLTFTPSSEEFTVIFWYP